MSSNLMYRRSAKGAQHVDLDDSEAVILSEESRQSVGIGALLCGERGDNCGN